MSYVDELRRYAQKDLHLAFGSELEAAFDRWTKPEFLASLIEPLYAVAHELGVDPGQCGPLVDELLVWLVDEAYGERPVEGHIAAGPHIRRVHGQCVARDAAPPRDHDRARV